MKQTKLSHLLSQSFILTGNHSETTFQNTLKGILNDIGDVRTVSAKDQQMIVENIIYAIKMLSLDNAILACTILARIQDLLQMQPNMIIPVRDTVHAADHNQIYQYLDALLRIRNTANIPRIIRETIRVPWICRRYAIHYTLEQIACCLRNNAFPWNGYEDDAIQAVNGLQRHTWMCIGKKNKQFIEEISERLYLLSITPYYTAAITGV